VVKWGGRWIFGKITGYLTDMCAVGLAGAALLTVIRGAADAPESFAELPEPTVHVAAADIDPRSIEQEMGVPGPGSAIFSENADKGPIQSLAGMILGRFTDLDVYDVKARHLSDSDVEKVANSEQITVGAREPTVEERAALLRHMMAQERLTNELVDAENAKKEGKFRDGTAIFDSPTMYIDSVGSMIGYFCAFFFVLLGGLYLVITRSLSTLSSEVGHALLVGAALFETLIFVSLHDYGLRPGFVLISPLFGAIARQAVTLGAVAVAVAAVFDLMARNLRGLAKDAGVVLMTLLPVGTGWATIASAMDRALLIRFGGLFCLGLVLWALSVAEGDLGFRAVSAVLRWKRPRGADSPPVFAPAVGVHGQPGQTLPLGPPQRRSAVPGVVSAAVVVVAAVVSWSLFFVWGRHIDPALSAATVTPAEARTATHQLLAAVLFAVVGAEAWIGSIIAAVQRRGRPFAVAGIVIGAIALFGLFVPVAAGTMMTH
jgi:hypothetical protein